jgi:hypothetical protein
LVAIDAVTDGMSRVAQRLFPTGTSLTVLGGGTPATIERNNWLS